MDIEERFKVHPPPEEKSERVAILEKQIEDIAKRFANKPCPSCAAHVAREKELEEELLEERAMHKRAEDNLWSRIQRAESRLALLERVMQAAIALQEYAMPENCECIACQNLRAALSALKEGN